MARDAPRRRRRRHPQGEDSISVLERFAVVLLADADDDDEVLIALAIIRIARARRNGARFGRKYGPRGPYDQEKCEEFFNLLLHGASDRCFRAWFRMGREGFWHLLEQIHEDDIFVSRSNRPQRPVMYQLATFLCRTGAESALKVAAVMAIAEGSVFLYMDRVCKAIRRVRPAFLSWPEAQRRALLSVEMEEGWGFPGCVSIGDGSYIFLADKPLYNGFAFWCRKKRYAVIVQATVDHRAIISSFDFGWPGSVQDSRVFKNSHLWRHRQEYFLPHEYILVDKGYPLTPYTIRPFNDHDFTEDPQEAARRKRFNRRLSSLRIAVEHAFGRLKGRFPILRNMPGRDLTEIYKIIEALMILHNMLEILRDDPADIHGYNGHDDGGVALGEVEESVLDDMGGDDLYRAGLLRRKELLDLIEPMDN